MGGVHEATIAAFDDDGDRAVPVLATDVRQRLRAPRVFEHPVFDDVREEPRLATLRLVRFDNPVPDE